jgi:hypothetical protein
VLPAAGIAWELGERGEELVRELFLDVRVVGNELRWKGDDGAVWSMVLRGGKRGVWCNWGNPDQAGDALELVHWAKFPDERGRRESCQWAARWLGHDTDDREPLADLLERQRAANERQRRQALASKEALLLQNQRALARWLDNGASVSAPLSLEIQSYLRGRGSPPEQLPAIPRALRFSPSHYYDRTRMLPAMLAAVMDPAGRRRLATHVTYLQETPDGWRKAPVQPAKKVFGSYAGGFIPLLRGASNVPFEHAPPGDTVMIAEGIENGLAAVLCYADNYPGVPAPRVIACISVGNLRNIRLPQAFHSVIMVLDRDGENEAVREARAVAEQRFLDEGRSVQAFRPPPGIKDFADLALASQ